MKSRVAVMMVLALGIFMSGTGATLAVSGLAGSGSASSVQYPSNNNQPQNVLAEECVGGVNTVTGESCGESPPPPETQEVRQVASSGGGGGSLPFTGFVAIPVLIVGVGLLGAGVAMRLRMRSDDAA